MAVVHCSDASHPSWRMIAKRWEVIVQADLAAKWYKKLCLIRVGEETAAESVAEFCSRL